MFAIPKLLPSMAIVAALNSLAGFAGAAVLPAGGAVGLAGTTSAATPTLAGVVQDDPLHPFQIVDGGGNVLISGNLQDRVAKSNDLGTMIFSPRLRDLVGTAGAAPVEIYGISIDGYGGYMTDVEYRVDGLGDAGPNVANRSVDGETVTLRYETTPILPPDESYFNSILTNATAYAPIGTATIYARVGANGPFFSTTLRGINVPVPEPSASVIVLGALGLAATIRRRG
jgi:hypothetical protein